MVKQLWIYQNTLRFDAGDRVPTVTELESMLHISRGTIQNALRTLQEEKAVRIESRGHLGSFMTLKMIVFC